MLHGFYRHHHEDESDYRGRQGGDGDLGRWPDGVSSVQAKLTPGEVAFPTPVANALQRATPVLGAALGEAPVSLWTRGLRANWQQIT